jgi:hypothetical protein
MPARGIYRSLSLKGEWWLPLTPDRRVPGVLTHDIKAGTTLELWGSAVDVANIEAARALGMMTVHGHSIDGHIVSLFDAFIGELTSSDITHKMRQSFVVNTILLGAHVVGPDAPAVRQYIVATDQLASWIGKSPFAAFTAASGAGQPLVSQELFRVPLANGVELMCHSVMTREMTVDSMNWSLTPLLTLAAGAPMPLSVMGAMFGEVRDVFCALVGHAVNDVEIAAELEGGGRVEIIMSVSDEAPPAAISPFRILAPYRSVGEHLAPLFSYLWGTGEAFRKPINLAVGSYFDRAAMPRLDFLVLTQAMESLCREAYPGTVLDQALYDSLVSDFGAAMTTRQVGNDAKQALKARMKYGNELSLRTRLKKFATNLPMEL